MPSESQDRCILMPPRPFTLGEFTYPARLESRTGEEEGINLPLE